MFLSLLLLTGCPDYGFNIPSDNYLGGECGNLEYPGEDLETDPTCLTEEATATLPYIIKWYKDDWGDDSDNFHYISSVPIVASLTDDDGDGSIGESDVSDIIVLAYDQPGGSAAVVRAVSGDGGGAELFTIYDYSFQARGGLAAGDIDGDGIVEIVAPLFEGGVAAFEHDGTFIWQNDGLTAVDGEQDQVSIADMDGDGSPEIIVGASILSADGTLLGEGAEGRGGRDGTASFAVDLDGDGVQEVITGNAAYDITGATLWSSGLSDGYPGAADFDGDGQGEVVVSDGGAVWLLDTDGSVLWETTIEGADVSGPPSIGDFEGDGKPEIVVTTRDELVAIETDGSIKWTTGTTEATSGITSSVLFDFERDGLPELVHGGEFTLQVIATNTGEPKLYTVEHSNETALEYPVVVDLEGDGEAEIIAVSTPYENPNKGIRAFGPIDSTWPAARRVWTQHAWYLTNAEDDGSIPAVPETNWDVHNNFRSGDLSPGTGLLSPDLVVQFADLCDAECEAANIVFWVQLGNQGLGDTKETAWAVYGRDGGDEVLLAEGTVDAVPAGEWIDAIQIEVDVTGRSFYALRAEVDGGGVWDECDETNNEALLEELICVDEEPAEE